MIKIDGINYEEGKRYVFACVEGKTFSSSGLLLAYRESDGTVFYQSDQLGGLAMSIFLTGHNDYGPWRRELQPYQKAQS